MQDIAELKVLTISELCVDKELQKQGLGTEILKKSQDFKKNKDLFGYLYSLAILIC